MATVYPDRQLRVLCCHPLSSPGAVMAIPELGLMSSSGFGLTLEGFCEGYPSCNSNLQGILKGCLNINSTAFYNYRINKARMMVLVSRPGTTSSVTGILLPF